MASRPSVLEEAARPAGCSPSGPVLSRRRDSGGQRPLWIVYMALFWRLGAADSEFSILDEAQVLAAQMRKLAAEELGVVTMQRIFNSFVYTEKISNGESEVQQTVSPGGHPTFSLQLPTTFLHERFA